MPGCGGRTKVRVGWSGMTDKPLVFYEGLAGDVFQVLTDERGEVSHGVFV